MGLPELEERLAHIEKRLSRIEKAIFLVPVSSPVPAPPSSPAQPHPHPVSSQPPASPPSSAGNLSSLPTIAARSGTYYGYDAKPGGWLGIAAVICFVLAAGFIIKLSIDSGWLTPARQIGIAAVFGFSLIAAGFTLLNSDREYASFLPGAGIIVLYVTTYAAHSYYTLISFETAIAATSLLSILCIWLYMQIGHDIYAITAATGAYLAPAVLGLDKAETFSLYYFLLCSVAFATISIWVLSRLLTTVSAYLAIFMTAYIGFDLHNDIMVASMMALHFLIFTIGTYLYTVQTGQTLTRNEATGFMPVLLVFYAAEYYFIDRINASLAPWISLGFAALLIGFYFAAKTCFPGRSMNSQYLISSFATLVFFHSVYIELLPDNARPWLFVLIMLAVALLPDGTAAGKWRNDFPVPALAVFAIVIIEYLDILAHLFESYNISWLTVCLMAFASIWMVLIAGKQETYGNALLAAAHMLAICGFYRLTHEAGSLAVSAAWLVYAICVIIFAFARRDEVMAKSALLVLSFATGKALLFDAASAPTVIRILCLLLTGVALYGAGLLMRRISNWTHS